MTRKIIAEDKIGCMKDLIVYEQKSKILKGQTYHERRVIGTDELEERTFLQNGEMTIEEAKKYLDDFYYF